MIRWQSGVGSPYSAAQLSRCTHWRQSKEALKCLDWILEVDVEREPNLIISSASQRIIEDGIPFKVDIYKLEGGDGWSLEVVTEDGTSIVWDDLFDDDRAAFDEAVATIRKEGAATFANGGSNVVPFRH